MNFCVNICIVARWGHSCFEFHSLKFLQCKSHISPVQNPAFPILRVYLMRMLMNFILSQWLELVLADIEFLRAIKVLAWVVSRYGVVHMQADMSGSEDNSESYSVAPR